MNKPQDAVPYIMASAMDRDNGGEIKGIRLFGVPRKGEFLRLDVSETSQGDIFIVEDVEHGWNSGDHGPSLFLYVRPAEDPLKAK